MAETWSKRQRQIKKRNAKMAKMERRLERKENNSKGKGMKAMMAYVDEFGNLTETPPEKQISTLSKFPHQGSNRTTKPLGRNGEKTGIVIYFDDDKGYGFIKNDYVRDSIFVHASSSSVELEKDLAVTFELRESPKGLMAVNVKAAD